MWNSEFEELREESAAALGRARTLLATAQDLSAQAHDADAHVPERATPGTARAVADATRLVIRNSTRYAALTVLESEAAHARARATLRAAMDACAHSSRRRANRAAQPGRETGPRASNSGGPNERQMVME